MPGANPFPSTSPSPFIGDFPLPEPGARPRPNPSPSPSPGPQPLVPPLTLTQPVALPFAASNRCDCKQQKKRKPRNPRTVCYRGTYVETASGLSKTRKEEVSCLR